MNIQYDKSKIESTLKETSIDDSGLSNVVYLVEDPHTAENFDEISKQIAAKVRMGHKPRSCDALYRSGKYYNLIEFKNRKSADLRKGNEMVELHEKAFDSLGQLAIYLNYQNSLDNLAKETFLSFKIQITTCKGTAIRSGNYDRCIGFSDSYEHDLFRIGIRKSYIIMENDNGTF